MGKTTTMLIAMAEMVERPIYKTQVLMFVATLEAAAIAYENFKKITQFTDISATIVHFECAASNFNAQVVIGTPIELVKAFKNGLISLQCIKLVCFDDLDLTINFKDAQIFVRELRQQSQFMMCGSTASKHQLHGLIEFEVFQSPRQYVLSNAIHHMFIEESEWSKKTALLKGLAAVVPGQIIVFLSVGRIH